MVTFQGAEPQTLLAPAICAAPARCFRPVGLGRNYRTSAQQVLGPSIT